MEDESIFSALVMKGRYSLRSFLERKKHIRRDNYFFIHIHKKKNKNTTQNIAVLQYKAQNQACHLENNRQAGSTGTSSSDFGILMLVLAGN